MPPLPFRLRIRRSGRDQREERVPPRMVKLRWCVYIFFFLDMKSLERTIKKSIGPDTLCPDAHRGGVCPKDLIAQKGQRWLFGTVSYPSLNSSWQ